ncbi:MAG TPA: hypothetical protein VFU31_00585 [Candidatus Binatia bacterium]|nr:hypothetical protein [Candidatus Binatia bacterium]
MKRNAMLVGVVVAVVIALPLVAQELPALPDDIAKKEIQDWKWTGTNIVLGIMLLGRLLGGLRNGGGIVGAVKGVLFGTNTPVPPPPAPPSTPP